MTLNEIKGSPLIGLHGSLANLCLLKVFFLCYYSGALLLV